MKKLEASDIISSKLLDSVDNPDEVITTHKDSLMEKVFNQFVKVIEPEKIYIIKVHEDVLPATHVTEDGETENWKLLKTTLFLKEVTV